MTAGIQEKKAVPLFSPLNAGLILFTIAAAVWLYCLPPSLAPYRDAGEMACDVYTLGVAHQPGYPLYILSAKLFTLFAPGNFAYKLNLFSAFSGLAALMLVYLAFVPRFGALPAFLTAMLLAFNFTVQTVSSVAEMYALNLFFAAVLMHLALSFNEPGNLRRTWLTAFMLGLAMANRMDIVLMAPAIALAAAPYLAERFKAGALSRVFWAAVFWLAGFSLYLYLPVRSGSNPLFDWSHPADMATFLAVITRKSYGSTLDLISKNYAAGELFWPNIKYYVLHLFCNFNAALVFTAAGIAAEFRTEKNRFWFTSVLFIFSGPVFLFLANMPPNPHALAIVEPYYLLPDLAVALWTAAGLKYMLVRFNERRYIVVLAASAAILLAAYQNLPSSDRRSLFAGEDWAVDVMKSASLNASLVARKDVQIFTLWYLQTVRGMRPDLKLVPQGLSGAKWFRDSKNLWRPDLKLFNLNSGDASSWKDFSGVNSGELYSTADAELPKNVPAVPGGLLNALYSGSTPVHNMWRFYNFRWLERDYNDFFARDLGTSYAQSIVAGAAYLSNSGSLDAETAQLLELAEIMDEDLPDAPLYSGFYYAKMNDWKKAAVYFRRSTEAYDRLLAKAVEYRALPSLKENLTLSSAYSWLNYGVSLEKTGVPEGAEKAYDRALAANPNLADAHYNLAILYWNKDPERVRRELRSVLAVNPSHQRAAYYLAQIESKIK